MVEQLESPPVGWPVARMRHKLSKLSVPGFPEQSARRALRSLQSLSGIVAPRVQVAVLRSLYNGWITCRRFGERYAGRCRFGCGADCSLQHYLRCRVVHDFAQRHIGLDLAGDQRWAEMLYVSDTSSRRDPIRHSQRVAILHYVIYRAVHALRHTGPLHCEEVDRLLQQALIEVTRGHTKSRDAILVRSHM